MRVRLGTFRGRVSRLVQRSGRGQSLCNVGALMHPGSCRGSPVQMQNTPHTASRSEGQHQRSSGEVLGLPISSDGPSEPLELARFHAKHFFAGRMAVAQHSDFKFKSAQAPTPFRLQGLDRRHR